MIFKYFEMIEIIQSYKFLKFKKKFVITKSKLLLFHKMQK